MIDVNHIRARLSEQCSVLRQVDIGLNVDQAMQQSVQLARAWVIDLDERADRTTTTDTSQIITARFGVLLALPDLRRSDESNSLRDLRLQVRTALVGWALDGCRDTTFDSGSLVAGGPVCWWMDAFRTQYIFKQG